MFQNTRFSIALHAMASLGHLRGQKLQSQQLAQTIGTNASFLRQIISQLSEAGLVETKAGKGGGTTLRRAPEKISLLQIFQAVEGDCAMQTHTCAPDSPCVVAKAVPSALQDLSARIQGAIHQELSGQSLADILDTYVS